MSKKSDIWTWWLAHHDNIPQNVREYRDYLYHETQLSPDEIEEFMYDYKYATEEKNKPSAFIKADPVAKDVAMRKGLMYGARKILPRAVPYVGWGLLAKDIYDFFKD